MQGTPPQQSLVSRQRSPLTWQPLAGWHTSTPVGPYGAQRRLQQSPHPPQTVPSTPSEQYVAPEGGGAQEPTLLPGAMVHVAEQHSLPFEQMSPVCTQNEDPSWHLPPEQSFEQHSPSAAQELPAVWHAVLSGTHFPVVQVPLQHLAPLVHA